MLDKHWWVLMRNKARARDNLAPYSPRTPPTSVSLNRRCRHRCCPFHLKWLADVCTHTSAHTHTRRQRWSVFPCRGRVRAPPPPPICFATVSSKATLGKEKTRGRGGLHHSWRPEFGPSLVLQESKREWRATADALGTSL